MSEVEGATGPGSEARPELPPLRPRRSLATPISALMLLVVLATGGSAFLVLGQLRELRASFDLLTGVYVVFQERLGAAEVQSAKIGARIEQTDRLGGAPFEGGTATAERDLLLFADALEDRERRVAEVRQPVEEALAHPERIGGEHRSELEVLRADILELEQAVAFDEGVEDPLDVLLDVRRQNLINDRFRKLSQTASEIVQTQQVSVRAAGKRAENLTYIVTLAGTLLGLVAVVAVYLTLRPLRRLSQGVRRLGEGDWKQRIDLGGGPPDRDDEVSRLAREFNLMAGALQERERRVIRAERLAAVGQLAAQITHEVRNPLSSVALNAELLEDELDGATPEARALLRKITDEVDRLTALTEDYLAFARRPRPELAVIDLASELRELVAAEDITFAQEGVALEAEIEPASLKVEADASQLRRAFLNLLRNAREAVLEREDGSGDRVVRIEARCKGDWVVVVVIDTGVGIDTPPEERERIFEAFFTRKAKGTGLGLSTVQQIVADHGGRVTLRDTGPQGTTFEVRLPACAAEGASVSSNISEDGEIA